MHAWLRKRQRARARPVARHFVSRHKREALKACFEALDTDSSGSIEREELTFALHELGLSTDHANAILSEGDSDNDGHITLDEFVALVERVSALQTQREKLLEGAPRRQKEIEVASAFTAMLDQAANKHPLGLLANAVHIREAVTRLHPDNYLPRHTCENQVPQQSGPPPPEPSSATKGKLPPMPRGGAGHACSAPRATTAPLLKSSSHSRWLAQAGKQTRASSAANVRAGGDRAKGLTEALPPPPPPVQHTLTHASTAPQLLPKITLRGADELGASMR